MKRTIAGTTAGGALLLLAGCGLAATTSRSPDLPDEPPATALQAPTSSPAASTPASTGSSSTAATPGPAAQPVATRPGSFEKTKVTAQLYPVRRSGDTATVDLYIESQNLDETFMVFDNLSDGDTETAAKSMTAVDGIRLLDTTAKKAYLPAVTANGDCVCSPNDASSSEYRSSVWVTVTFAAPPASRSSISVSVPTFGTFTDVPLV